MDSKTVKLNCFPVSQLPVSNWELENEPIFKKKWSVPLTMKLYLEQYANVFFYIYIILPSFWKLKVLPKKKNHREGQDKNRLRLR